MDVLAQVLARTTADPAVRGLVLTGSYARGVATPRSDYDVTIVVAEQAEAWRHIRTTELDEVVCTVEALADTSVHWQRYAYRGAKVLLDRLDGGIAELVARQATPSPEETVRRARAALDGYVNQLYRAVESYRDGAAAGAERLRAIVSSQVQLINVLNIEIAELGQVVTSHFGRHRDVERYLSLPGLSPVLGARILGEFGDDPHRYVDAKAPCDGHH